MSGAEDPSEIVAHENGALARQQNEAEQAIAAARAMLGSAVFERQVPIALLTKLASDDSVPVRERRRCAEVLAQLQIKLIETVAGLTGAKEKRLQDLGIEGTPESVNLTQVNNRIEIVREGTGDWRTDGRGP